MNILQVEINSVVFEVFNVSDSNITAIKIKFLLSVIYV